MDPKANWRLIACATPILAVAAAWSRPTTQVPQSAGVPRGTIVMWAGAASQVPAGWHTCDGTAGTPDLRDRFVRLVSPGVVRHVRPTAILRVRS